MLTVPNSAREPNNYSTQQESKTKFWKQSGSHKVVCSNKMTHNTINKREKGLPANQKTENELDGDNTPDNFLWQSLMMEEGLKFSQYVGSQSMNVFEWMEISNSAKFIKRFLRLSYFGLVSYIIYEFLHLFKKHRCFFYCSQLKHLWYIYLAICYND